ncbi:MAG TPA: hypothetical protein VMZ27_03765, partial [Candidatus Saccharimonadales bacterium]|nr:hypothetical protein [Candidatus Saccharimonadales bacterium]
MTCSTPLRMFGAIKRIFNKTPVSDAPKASPLPKNSATPAAPPPTRPVPQRFKAPDPVMAAGENHILLTLSKIVALLPKDLQAGVSKNSLDGLTFTIAKEKILPQLGQGAVKITYGELCRAFPAGIFANKPAEDGRFIDLPLQEILSQVEPQSFSRRQLRPKVEVPDEITELFSPKGLASVRVLKKDESKTVSTEMHRKSAAAIAPAPVAPAPLPEPSSIPAPAFAMPQATMPQPTEAQAKSIAVNPHLAALMKEVGVAPRVTTPAPPYAPPRLENGNLVITLGDMCQGWPDGVSTEIKVSQLTNHQCEIPVAELTAGMKAGKTKYPWKQ